jgi:Cys-tRNA(Pro)/Cys-tRNA(Cys) deacylase
MRRVTPATRQLDAAGIAYRLHAYDYDPTTANIGRHAASALGVAPARMLKTLLLAVDGKPACAVLPVDRELSLKKFAAALGGKQAALLPAAAAERVTGYHLGGISPFGQKKRLPLVLERSVLEQAQVLCNAGQRGLQLELAPQAVAQLPGAICAVIVSEDASPS